LTPESPGYQTAASLSLIPGIIEPLNLLADQQFELVIVTNQPYVARGTITEQDVEDANQWVMNNIESSGGPKILSAQYCPHHPNADLVKYRTDCECRKPRPGMLTTAAEQHGISLPDSFMIGDRMTDVAAATAAGCTAVLIDAGEHTHTKIETSADISESIEPSYTCQTLLQAATWIIDSA
jgi:D-glycero-D-manno-heptose 1,7-bisphosphate phosphatase